MLKLILIFLAGTGIGGTVGVFAMSLAASSKVEPPPLLKNMTMNQNEAEETAKSDED